MVKTMDLNAMEKHSFLHESQILVSCVQIWRCWGGIFRQYLAIAVLQWG